MVAEAIEAYLESLQIDGEPILESDAVEPRAFVEPARVGKALEAGRTVEALTEP